MSIIRTKGPQGVMQLSRSPCSNDGMKGDRQDISRECSRSSTWQEASESRRHNPMEVDWNKRKG